MDVRWFIQGEIKVFDSIDVILLFIELIFLSLKNHYLSEIEVMIFLNLAGEFGG